MPALRNRILFALGVLLMAAPAGADSLPASVRACIGEADAGRRLACYDREVARLIAPADTFMQPAAAAPAAARAPAASAAVPAVASALPRAASPRGGPPRHFTAKVSSVHGSGDDLVVSLDNGDVWEQSEPATSQLNLRPGDVVQMDREMSGWFLSNRYGDDIQVRLRPRAADSAPR